MSLGLLRGAVPRCGNALASTSKLFVATRSPATTTTTIPRYARHSTFAAHPTTSGSRCCGCQGGSGCGCHPQRPLPESWYDEEPGHVRQLASSAHDLWNEVHVQLHNRFHGQQRQLQSGQLSEWTVNWAQKASNEWLSAWANDRARLRGDGHVASSSDPEFKFPLSWRDAISLFFALHQTKRALKMALHNSFVRRHYHPWQAPCHRPPASHRFRGPHTWDPLVRQQHQQQGPQQWCGGAARLFATIPYMGGRAVSALKSKPTSTWSGGGGGGRKYSSGPGLVPTTLVLFGVTAKCAMEFAPCVALDQDDQCPSSGKMALRTITLVGPRKPIAEQPLSPILFLSLRPQPIRMPSVIELELSPTQRKWCCVRLRIPCPILAWRLARFATWITSRFKNSSALSVIHTVTRIVMTLVPLVFIQLRLMTALLKKLPEDALTAARRAKFLKKIKCSRKTLGMLFMIPLALIATTLLSSLEKTPLTGRPRLILLSPQEEDEVARQLQGPGWYSAVADILMSNAKEGDVPKVIPTSDWRYQWVAETLRQLERSMMVLRDEAAHHDTLAASAPAEVPVPPPSKYPLVPRPRVAQIVHCFFHDLLGVLKDDENAAVQPANQTAGFGPPYNLLLIDKPDTSNGFSYGFGGNASAGIVVFSGFLDEILHNTDSTPTREQTAQLAVLLAHEIAHIILSHHLETLSSSTILAPNVANIFSDVARTLLFPLTMLLGPFVNDAVANMTKVTQNEMVRGHDACFNRRLEIEADLVSARLLAYAGYDPRIAVDFWESRLASEHDVGHHHHHDHQHGPSGNFMQGDTHPIREERILRLKQELARWLRERKPSSRAPHRVR